MLGIRQKLTLAFGGLLALVFVVAATSLAVLNDYSTTLERIFRENYDSIHYAQEMRAAVEILDDVAERALWGNGTDTGESMDAAIVRFEENHRKELANITLPGEHEVAVSLGEGWERYKREVAGSLAGNEPRAVRRSFYQEVLLVDARSLRELTQRIIDLNMANMVSVDGQVRAKAFTSRRTMYGLMALGLLLAAIFTASMGRSILVPLGRLTASAGEIGRGNLDLDVEVSSGDEIGQLAEAFRAMTARLREFRDSDRARLVRTERTTQLALDSFPDPVALVGPDGTIELANKAAERLFALVPGSALERADQAPLREIVATSLRKAEPFRPTGYESAIRSFDGSDRIFQPQAVPIPGEDGSTTGITLVLADVTSLRRLDESKNNLLSVVSHELKTPLTSIRMATHLLQEGKAGPLTPRQQDLLSAASEDADRLHTILEGLLDIGRIQSGRALLDLEPGDVGSLVAEAASAFDARFAVAGVSLIREVEPSLPLVLVDVQRVRHVFANLLDNALRFSRAGSRVAITAKADGPFVCVSIRDEGPGIDAAHLPRIFDRFFRVPDQTDESGAGLGLAIVKEIVEAHGGNVTVESQVGRGTTFRVRLRLAPAGGAPGAISLGPASGP